MERLRGVLTAPEATMLSWFVLSGKGGDNATLPRRIRGPDLSEKRRSEERARKEREMREKWVRYMLTKFVLSSRRRDRRGSRSKDIF